MTFKQHIVRIISFYHIFRQWKRLSKQAKNSNYQPSENPVLVLVPCDPWSVGGSRGDEAMLTAVIEQYRHRYPNIPIYIICAEEGKGYIQNLPIKDIHPVSSWNGNYPLEKICNDIASKKPTDVIVLGADCIDGHYSPSVSLMLVSIFDICKNLSGMSCKMMGFSFNDHPSKLMILALKSLARDVCMNLRDELSLMRYRVKVGGASRLVADAAFMLNPQYDFQLYYEVKHWIESQRNNGQTIIGLNFHPMLRSYSGPEDIKSDAILLAKNVAQIMIEHPEVSFVFIPHDDRSNITDNLMLSTMYEYLSSDKIYYSPAVPRASQLKALCGLVDGLISSRMHLAIAALGMQVPVMAATYQDKFEGLFRHFDLDEKYLMSPQCFLSTSMVETFRDFLKEISTLRQHITEKLPYVVAQSHLNLSDNE